MADFDTRSKETPSSQEVNALLALFNQARYAEAVALAEAMTKRLPRYAFGWKALGAVFRQLGRNPDALLPMRKAVALSPGDAEAHNNLGTVLRDLGQLEAAAASCRRALTLKPDFADAHNSLASALRDLGHLDDAATSCRRALAINPLFAEAHYNLGNILNDLGQLAGAAASYRQALEIKPNFAEAHGNLGVTLAALGEFSEAVANYRRALEIRPDSLQYAVQTHLTLPVIVETVEALEAHRERFEAGIAALMRAPGSLDECGAKTNVTSFYLAYHNHDNCAVMKAQSLLFREKMPGLTVTSPHLSGWKAPLRGGRRIRVGFLSDFLGDHTIGRLYQGFIRRLDRARFEVIVIRTPKAKRDSLRQGIDEIVDKAVTLPASLPHQQQAVMAEKLDVLFYPDIGMAPSSYFLAHARLAPVQVVGWGHPDSTGISTIDYFVSAASIEPEGADACYSERLVRLSRLPCFYEPVVPDNVPNRASLNLPETGTLYGCPQSLFKFHPDFDRVLLAIAKGDPEGRIVLLEGLHPASTDQLKARWSKTAPILLDRVLFLPRMPVDRFMALIAHVDVLLDPIHFGSGNTLYDAMTLGTPIVTWPGRFMRGRVVAGAYRQMEIANAPIASRLEDYATLALTLARSPERRQRLKEELKTAAYRHLFEDTKAMRELESFLEAAVTAAEWGEKLPPAWTPGIPADGLAR